MRVNKISLALKITVTLILVALIYINSTQFDKNSIVSIGKVYNVVSGRYTQKNAEYYYYYGGAKYQGRATLKNKSKNEVMYKYFAIQISTKNPKISKIDFEIEIKDSKKIKDFNERN